MKDHKLPAGEGIADELTWREQEVLILLAEHLTNQEISNRLHLAETTVKDYVSKILSKLYVKNRRQAVTRAIELGLLEPERKPISRHTSRLPAEPTPFVGRKGELTQIKRQLLDTRFVTLTGPGGIGKTRLALKAAVDLVDDFEDGCYFISLAPIRSSEYIIQTIAEAVKFPLPTHEDPLQQLLRFLRKKQLLLVMDNFEHLLDGVNIVSEILQAAPDVKILATSRERLYLQSETYINISGMAVPDGANEKDIQTYDSIHLFTQSARKVRPAFNPSPDELNQIVNICQIVQGMPLAIELAAAWLHILNVNEITEELKKDLAILSGEVRDAPQRHRSIRNVFDHSWELLNLTERGILMRLSVFRGGFTRQAAQQVTEASLQQLAGLVNKSLINHNPESGRLEVHELLRQYAQERLEVRSDVFISTQAAHAAYYADFMQHRWEDIRGNRQLTALTEIGADIENVRTAWRHYLELKDTAHLWMLIYSLWFVCWFRWWNLAGMEMFREAARVLEGALDEDTMALRAFTLALQGYFLAWLDHHEQGYELSEKSAQILQDLNHPMALAITFLSMGVNAYFLSQYADEIMASDNMLKIAKEMGDKWLLALTLFTVGMGCLLREEYDEARRYGQTHLALSQEIGDVCGAMMALVVLGHSALASKELAQAREYYLRCLKKSEEIGFFYGMQTASKYLAKVTISMNLTTEAEGYLRKCLRITNEIGFMRDIINMFYEYARLYAAQGNVEAAVELLGLVVQHPASRESRFLDGRIRDNARELLASLEVDLPPQVYAAALERGQEMNMDRIIDRLLGSKRVD
jgi:predicted ATPase/DNA-binding CsgD family transcriptional regulator